MSEKQTVHAACPHDCPDTCAMLVQVENGRAVKVSGDADHPPTRGFLCTKVTRYLERVYNPGRVLYPMRRVGLKGEGRFERITWDEALDTIARRFKEFARMPGGPETILPYSYGGTMGLVNGSSMDRRFFHRVGASLLDRTICASAGGDAMLYTVGGKIGTDVESFHRAKFIVLWGTNTLVSNIHLWPEIRRAVENGAKLVGIDPYRNRTMDHCHKFLQVRPGTDGAFAFGVMNVILRDRLEDAEFIEKHTLGFDHLQRRIAEFPAARAAAICGVGEEDLVEFAREYATTRPAVIRVNYGLQRHAGGGNAVRAIACLPALTGAWREVGGGVLLSSSGYFAIDQKALERPDLIRGNPRTINMSRLGEALTEATPPVRALFVYNSNPAAVAPDQGKVIEGLKREDLFTVVHEQFQTDTADYADILLPATTQLEHRDLVKPYGHYYLVYNEPAIAPLGEAKPNWEVFSLLAERMGFDEDCFKDTDEDIIRQAIGNGHPMFEGITLEGLKRDGWAAAKKTDLLAPFADGAFPTPSGKCEFYSERLAKMGVDPVPLYIPPRESPETAPALAARFPLQLLSPPAGSFLNTSFSHLPSFLKAERRPIVEINAGDASSRGIGDGDLVRVWNERGECTLYARISDRVSPGVAVALSTWWNKLSPGGSNVNVTVSQALTDIGGGATFYDNLVEIAPVREPASN
ncbi:MAG TPA: molybdopterin oxidoreductase family protein [Blastocatellia bacterium]|nr:molybdopterin oxidoreductase family protein [Blastocatellia bacterium]